MNRARAVLTALVLASALSLAGCSDDDPEPQFAPPSSEPPESPSTTAAAADSADAVVKAWVEAQNQALADGDVSGMQALSAPGCRGCAEFSSAIKEVYDAGGRYEGGEWSIIDIHRRSGSGEETTLDVAMAMDGGRTFEDSDATPVSYKPDRKIVVFRVTPGPGGLKLSLVGFVQ